MSKIKEILAALLLTLGITHSIAQPYKYYTPLEIQQTYTDSTRSLDGRPGINYWQNTADYKISVALDPENYLINGSERVIYFNNSPKNINRLTLRLYANAFKKGAGRRYNVDSAILHNGVKLKKVSIDGQDIDINNRNQFRIYGTVANIILNDPIEPQSEIVLVCDWQQSVPKQSPIRTGATDTTAFFIGYFYPQISVYDDIFGWDRYAYNLQTEFYNNLANFDVKITTPENYFVVGTGTLQNAKDVLPKSNFKKLQKAMKSDTAIEIISSQEVLDGFKAKSTTWHYKATDVSDFAFCTSNKHGWAGAKQTIDDRDVFIGSVYPVSKNINYALHISNQRKTMLHFSNDIPGIPYPYEAFTSYISSESGGGMEFPMMANNGGDGLGLTIHEMFHTYFPMYVRCNEKLWAFMDEGWAVYNTLMVENKYFKNKTHATDFINDGRYMWIMGKIQDMPLITPSQFIGGASYYSLSYGTSATFNTILHHYLGDEMFLKCYREFITRWAKKSPTPYDFFYTFEDVSGEDLSWLIKPWYFEYGYANIGIKTFENDTLTIANNGVKPVPVFIELRYKNDSIQELEYTAGIWENRNTEFKIPVPDAKNVKAIHINQTIADVNREDNNYPKFKSESELLLGLIKAEGVEKALSIYKGWIEKNPNIYLNHNYSNIAHLNQVISVLEADSILDATNAVKAFIAKEFPVYNVTFKVITNHPPESNSIYITGNQQILGNWNPAINKMNLNEDGTYSISFDFEKHTFLKFRFTGGNWQSQMLNGDSSIPKDIEHTVESDTTLTYTINNWKK